MEIWYNLGKRRGLPVRMASGNCIISGVALCVICYHYYNSRGAIKESYASMIDKLLQDT